MDFPWLIWLFSVFSALQPVLQQRLLGGARLRLLGELERERGSRVIALIHRQETLSLLGFPLVRYIDINDSEAILRAIKLTDDKVPIDLILHLVTVPDGGSIPGSSGSAETRRRRCAG